jgi:hypothetical protein
MAQEPTTALWTCEIWEGGRFLAVRFTAAKVAWTIRFGKGFFCFFLGLAGAG